METLDQQEQRSKSYKLTKKQVTCESAISDSNEDNHKDPFKKTISLGKHSSTTSKKQAKKQ